MGLLTPDEMKVLSEWATTDPEEALVTLSRAIALRETVHQVLSTAIVGEPSDTRALTVLNWELSEALSRLRVVHAADNAFVWSWERGGDGRELLPEYPLWPVVHSAAKLLISPRFSRVKVCAGEGCAWMFVDESRNKSRRWCDSADCGNRERVRKHLARKRASQS